MTLPATQHHYTLDTARRQQYSGIYLLRRMVNTPVNYSLLLENEDRFLEPILQWLYSENWVNLRRKEQVYAPNASGREHLVVFEQQYHEYLKVFDLPFSAVDTGNGTFAAEHYFSMSDEAYNAYVKQPNWEDLRVAVAEFKGMNPVDIVFMSFLNEGRLDHASTKNGWQFDLYSGLIFDEILNVCNNSLHADQLETLGIPVDVVIQQGSQLMVQLLQQEEAITQQRATEAAVEAERQRAIEAAQRQQTRYEVVTETIVEPVTRYRYVDTVIPVYQPVNSYLVYVDDPYHVSPVFQRPWYW